jgi:hypothetical protein
MAKKDEEDMMEDYDADEAEDKPKKKASKRKKKSKTWIWVVAFVVILAILLLIRWKYTPTAALKNETPVEEQAPPEVVENQYVTEPAKTTTKATPSDEQADVPRELGDQVVPKEDIPNVQENIDTTAEPKLFSNFKCEYDETAQLLYISLHIYNVFNEEMRIAPHGVQKGYNTYFKIRGNVITDPGCGTEILAPGEYTDCKRIGFSNARYSDTPGINRISAQTPGGTEALLIECPAVPDDAPVLQWIRK